MTDTFKVPRFTSEAEEAQWWFDHREELAKAFEDAAARGELRRGSATKRAQEQADLASTTVVQLEPEDVSRAQALAQKRGLLYQSYLRMLLREALEAEEKKLAS